MPQILIEEVRDGDLKSQPVFAQIERRLEKVRRRAFELYQMRGCEPGRSVEDWLKAEREVLGWPPLETQENDQEFEFQVPLDDFDVSQVTIIVTPSEIIVHAKTEAERQEEEAGARSGQFAATEIYRRIELAQPIKTERTRAIFDKGALRITAAKVGARRNMSWTAAA
jgi:HSP20 family molecular chaperone IbpA